MAPSEMLRQLEALAERLGVAVRFDVFDAGPTAKKGGLCRLRGQDVIVVDDGLGVLDKVEVLAAALAMFDSDHVYVAPEVRRNLERRQQPARSPGPSLRKARARPSAGGG